VIHLQGMGWFGAATAFALARARVPFTWDDPDEMVCAWRACTGMVYPAGDARSEVNLRMWHAWYAERLFPEATVTPVAYVYTHKAPPHQGRYRQHDLGPFRLGQRLGVAVDAPAIVAAARERFEDQRTDRAPVDARVLRTHGFTERCTGYRWGWNRPVRLGLPPELIGKHRPALYSRRNRFQIVYAYVIPTRPGWWWAGSSLVAQRIPKPLDAEAHWAHWLEAWKALWPTVPVRQYGDLVQGWRPVPARDDSGWLEHDTVPPLWHSGVRWAPELVETIVRRVT